MITIEIRVLLLSLVKIEIENASVFGESSDELSISGEF